MLRKRDDKNLWENYGSKGAGFAIGISSEYFNGRGIPDGEWFNGVAKVYYGEDLLQKIVNKVKFSACTNSNDIVNLFSEITPFLPQIKELKFEREKEYRIYTLDKGMNDKIPDKFKYDIEGKCKMDTNPIPLKYIKEILIGSKNDIKSTETKILLELKRIYPDGGFEHILISSSKIIF